MEIKQLFDAKKKDIEAKKYNIFIPICLGNKFFSEKGVINENVEKYLQWALEHTKEKVLFVVVDKIQDTNYFVRNHRTSENAILRSVFVSGEKIKDEIESLIKKYPKEIVDVIKWEDYEKSNFLCNKISHIVYKEFKNNEKFRCAVLGAVKTSITDRKFSDEDYFRLCDYVLDEFGFIYSGLDYKGTHYNLYPYPYTDLVLELIENIKKGLLFPELYKKLPEIKTSVVILR